MSEAPKDRRRVRHAQAETLARFLRETGKPTSKDDLEALDECALKTQDREALKIMEDMVGRATDRFWNKKLAEVKGQIPLYIAIFLVFLCVSIVLYFTRLRS